MFGTKVVHRNDHGRSATLAEGKSSVGTPQLLLFGWNRKYQITNHFSCLVGGSEILKNVTLAVHGVWVGGNEVPLSTLE